jgi:dienelactone hydrolase
MSPQTKIQPVFILANGEEIRGVLHIPQSSTAMVVFVDVSGDSRPSPRNEFVTQVFNERGISTLHIDLLTPDKNRTDIETAHLRFNIDLLAHRLGNVTHWLLHQSATSTLHPGYIGVSTGAAAALVAAARTPEVIEAVVSLGGLPDLAGPWLMSVHSPTLFIIGEHDDIVRQLNQEAALELRVEHRVEIVPGAGHFFEEPGALQRAANLAHQWFEAHLITANRKAS